MRKVTGAGGIILNKEGKIAVVSQFGEDWAFPKGKVEADEKYIEAAIREIYEETGITELALLADLGSYEYISQGKHQFDNEPVLKKVFMFLFRTSEQTLKPNDKDNPKALWVDPEEVESYINRPHHNKFYNEVKSAIKRSTTL